MTGVVVTLVLIIAALIVVIVILWNRKRGRYSIKKAPGSHIDNLTYDNACVNPKPDLELIAIDNVNYIDPGEHTCIAQFVMNFIVFQKKLYDYTKNILFI